MANAPTCPVCRNPGRLVDSAIVYGGRSYGSIWYCDCVAGGVYVGCHKGTSEPLGTMATAGLRELRKRAHAAFDPLWRDENSTMSRSQAYSWLASRMGIPVDECHIAMFNEEQCEEAERVCLYRRNLFHVKRPKRFSHG